MCGLILVPINAYTPLAEEVGVEPTQHWLTLTDFKSATTAHWFALPINKPSIDFSDAVSSLVGSTRSATIRYQKSVTSIKTKQHFSATMPGTYRSVLAFGP